MTCDEAIALAKSAGIDVDYVSVYDDRVIVAYDGDLTFEKLAKLSEAFGTTRIDLGIEKGCASDPSVDPYIVVWGKFA